MESNVALYIIWTAGKIGETELNAYAVYKNSENTSFSLDPITGKVTVTAKNTTSLMYIGN